MRGLFLDDGSDCSDALHILIAWAAQLFPSIDMNRVE